MRLINGNLVQMIANPADIALREQIMLGSMQAGLAFSNAILGAVHAMSHSLGGYLDLPTAYAMPCWSSMWWPSTTTLHLIATG